MSERDDLVERFHPEDEAVIRRALLCAYRDLTMTNDTPELLPCPSCSHAAPVLRDGGRGLIFTVECGTGGCRMRGPWERCAIDAQNSWNKLPRASDTAKDRRIAELEKALREIADYKWPDIIGMHESVHFGEATGREYRVKHPVPKQTASQALASVQRIARAILGDKQ